MKLFDSLNSGSEQDFHHSVVAIQAGRGALHNGVGSDTLPKNEVLRFKVPQNLGFPGKALERVEPPNAGDQPYTVFVNFFGLTGPSGVMPRHYSEWVMDRCKQKDESLRDFLDIFHHRLISLYHRAWEKYQFPLQYQRQQQTAQQDPISRVLSSLSGTSSFTQQYLGGLFSQSLRSAQGLKQIVGLISGCKVVVNERLGQWLSLSEAEQTRLASRANPEGQHAQLGFSATLGHKVWDVGSAIEIEIHAANATRAQQLLPGSKTLSLLQEVVADYLPTHIRPRWSLMARYRDMPSSRLGSSGLGLGQGSALTINSKQMDEQTKVPIA
ncbi:type VI secretion system baseplate subunit TssG [Agarivorans gilvus]|uniref:Type VI secretion protein n=1 Tax=Agarivorans gilvus TaxID=680279 RepID=A0ABQ1I6G4_9ALTE|nr:type VI secretion system baseplate subunit TssG [Agarivorans gilvus]GGB20100.1 type VI secretion protein [Agarivorans gilvus]